MGATVEWKALELTTMLWQPTSYDPDSNALDFCFKPTAELLRFLANLEAEVLSQISKDSDVYFGARMAPEKVRGCFQSNLKTSHTGMDHFKCKGRYSTQILGPEFEAHEGTGGLGKRRPVSARHPRHGAVV